MSRGALRSLQLEMTVRITLDPDTEPTPREAQAMTCFANLGMLGGYKLPEPLKSFATVTDPHALRETLAPVPALQMVAPPARGNHEPGTTWPSLPPDQQRELLRAAMEEAGYNTTRAAALLGICTRAMRYRLKHAGLKPDQAPGLPRGGNHLVGQG